MPAIDKYVPLKQVVSYFLDEQNKSMKDFDKAWLFAFRGLVDLGFNISAEPKSVRLPVSANNTVTLPSDYLSWSKIGVLNSKGELCSIKVNNALSILRDNNPNREDYLTPDINNSVTDLSTLPYFFNYYNNGSLYNLFGIGGGLIQYGECRVDERNGVIVLGENFQYDSIVIEYISCPQMDGDYQVELALQEALIAFIAWKFKLGTEQSYYARSIEARRRLPGKKVTLQNINQVIREATGMYLKS